MAEPTLIQLFGTGASQDASTINIPKTALVSVGLTATPINTAESLVVALIKLWQSTLTPTNLEANIEQQITIEDSFQSIITRGTTQYRQFSKTINLQIVDTTSDIDPDSF